MSRKPARVFLIPKGIALAACALLADAAHSRQAAKPNRKRYDFDF